MTQTMQHPPLPKRLVLIMLGYAALSLWGLWSGTGVMLALLSILMLLAISIRHKAGLWLLRGYAITALAASTTLPYLLQQNPALYQQLQHSGLWPYLQHIPGWLSISVLIVLSMLQLWLVFTAKVSAFFQRNVNFNLMQ
ncbi:hypothetical protein [Shewanella sp. YIC-542]|uniref:hypothetical protein n=1 Tax=Shewanella mytili TaxID=3377111 RepID=UPI00398ED0D7